MTQKPYLTDGNDKPIVAAQAIKISEIAIATGTWTAVPVPAGTRAGLYTTDTGNGFDNFNAWARGTEGQYASLVRY